MASTWLVDTKLMLKVNSEIDATTIDDTFNIQLELFNKTNLTYLPEPTVVYRDGYDSDSKPVNIQKETQRNERLYRTQLEYLDKYRDADFVQISKLALTVNKDIEKVVIDLKNNLESAQMRLAEQNIIIDEQKSLIADILSSRSYRLASKIVYPINLIRLFKAKLRG